MTALPKKLKDDAIAEVTSEVRFDCSENRDAPEMVVGMLASHPLYKNMQRKRLPLADVPDQLRRNDSNLHGRPLLELFEESSGRKVRIGTHSLSISHAGAYPGWEEFKGDIKNLTDVLFNTVSDISIYRLGLRYVNVLEREKHKMNAIHELDFEVRIDEKVLDGELNLNFIRSNKDDLASTIRIASPDFVNNIEPQAAIGIIDIDTICSAPARATNSSDVQSWFERAHDFEKVIFFGLFKDEVLRNNVEEWQ